MEELRGKRDDIEAREYVVRSAQDQESESCSQKFGFGLVRFRPFLLSVEVQEGDINGDQDTKRQDPQVRVSH